MRNALIIYNPVAGRRRYTFFRRTVARLEHSGMRVTLQSTAGPGDAERFARAAVAQPEESAPDIVIAAGGDGTISEVANGLAGSSMPLGIIPMGTANVLAHEIGLRQRSRLVARTLVQGLASPIHLGRAGERRFIMMASFGFDARVVARVGVKLKYRWGRIAYATAAIRELIWGSRPRFDITVDGVTHHSTWVIVSKGHHYGGRFVVARDARLEDPSLTVCLLPGERRIDLIRYVAAIAMGRLHRQHDVIFIKARDVQFIETRNVPVEIDGDSAGVGPLRLTIGETLQLVRPA